ncbi:MAG: histidinol-phosphate transaminase [Propionibacterium sp.]|nr:MAG: histidinol-phosphate transaminase [Propionibacterium sp.]
MSLADLPLRDELVGQQPYGAPQLDVAVQLNVNENPYQPSNELCTAMAAAIGAAAKNMNRYPDREATKLRQGLAEYLGEGLSTENIWAANGSNEVITQLLAAFGGPGRKLLTFTPTYSMYPEYGRNTYTEYVTVERDSSYNVTTELALAAVEKYRPDIILLASPNNPTGTATDLATIAQICANTDAIVIIDEAYQEFSPVPSAITLLSQFPRLVVSRTMSKAFAFAGGRVGYLAAHPAIVDACRIVRLPYHLSMQTQVIAQVALAHAAELLANVAELTEQCQLLQTWLINEGFSVVPSAANFCLFGEFEDRHQVWQYLLDRGVLIRETGPSKYLRVSAGKPEEMSAFKAALTEWKIKNDRA